MAEYTVPVNTESGEVTTSTGGDVQYSATVAGAGETTTGTVTQGTQGTQGTQLSWFC